MATLSRSLRAVPLLCSACGRRFGAFTGVRTSRHSRPSCQFSTFIPRYEHRVEEIQAQSLSGYYADLLATPIPRVSPTRQTPTQPVPPTKEQRAKILYGAERKYRPGVSPASTWQAINGVPIPPRPAEPDNCCMSGCVHCVWDDYREEVEEWAVRLRAAQAKAQARGRGGAPKAAMARSEVADASSSMDDDGGGSEGLWDAPAPSGGLAAGEDLFQAIPVGIREFMATEKRLRDRKKRREKSVS